MRKFSLLVLVLGVGFAAGCRDSGDGGDDTPNPDGGTTNNDDVTIQEIQNDAMPACNPADPTTCKELKIRGVVVTAIDKFGDRVGDFWVQEPSGGPFSGVQVYGAPVDQVAALQVGDVVDITGAQKTEFALSSNTSGDTLTELEPLEGGTMNVTKVMSGTPLQPQAVDALAIGQMTDFMARNAEWEKWEGVLVILSNVQAFSATDCIKSSGVCNDETYERFDLTGDIQVQSSLAAMPDPKIARGDCLASVTGILSYFFDYHILPRTTAEIATGGTSCPTENQSATCGDSIDNDGNGFTDCGDFSCVTTQTACSSATTISAIQTAATPPTGGVKLEDVYVAAISKNKKNMWVQTDLTASVNNGIYVYGTGADLTYAVGSRVTVIGTVEEFNDATGTGTLTELKALEITAGTAGTGVVVPVTGQTVTNLKTDATGEQHESVLVTLTNVKVTTVGTTGTGGTFGVGEATQGGVTFKTDDDIFLLNTANACYATITGIWSYLPYNDQFGFLPLAAGTGTGTCP